MKKTSKKFKEEIKKTDTTQEIFYGLLHIESGELLRMEIIPNTGGHYCGPCTVSLVHGDNTCSIYQTSAAFEAEYVRLHSTEWYNSSEITPGHHYKPEELQLVEIRRVVTITPKQIEIPSWLELMRLKYEEKDPEHYKNLLDYWSENQLFERKYSLYDLLVAVDEGIWKPPKE